MRLHLRCMQDYVEVSEKRGGCKIFQGDPKPRLIEQCFLSPF